MFSVEQTIFRDVNDINNESPKNMELYHGSVAQYIWEKYEDTIMPKVFLWKVEMWKGTELEIKETYEEYLKHDGQQCLMEGFYATPVEMWPNFEEWFEEAVVDELNSIIMWLNRFGP